MVDRRPDVIIVGAGAGGPVVAKELAQRGAQVLMLEAGPWLDPERPSLIHWVEKGGDRRLAEWLRLSLMSGLPLEEGRRRLMRRWRQSRLGRSVAEATASPEHERREAGRRAVAGLVRRITQSEQSDDPGHDS